MYGPKLFFGGFPKKEIRCCSIPVSEICEFNWKKEKMNNTKNGYFQGTYRDMYFV